jgi:predicted transcriptional regulator
MDRAFGGRSAALVMHALSAQPASADELQEIRNLIEQYKAR